MVRRILTYQWIRSSKPRSIGIRSPSVEDKDACDKWVRLNPYLCFLKEHIDSKIKRTRKFSHIELGYRRKRKDESDVVSIVDVLDSWVPNIYSKDKPLINISNGKPAAPEIITNARSLQQRGEVARNAFFSRISCQKGLDSTQTLQYRDSIRKEVLLTFADKPKTEKKFQFQKTRGSPLAIFFVSTTRNF